MNLFCFLTRLFHLFIVVAIKPLNQREQDNITSIVGQPPRTEELQDLIAKKKQKNEDYYYLIDDSKEKAGVSKRVKAGGSNGAAQQQETKINPAAVSSDEDDVPPAIDGNFADFTKNSKGQKAKNNPAKSA